MLYFCANNNYNISAKGAFWMHTKERLALLAKENHGVLRTADVLKAGISKTALASSHGIYHDPNAWTDRLFLLQLRCPKTVYSHDTALFMHDLTDREPLCYSLTAKTGYNPSHLTKEGIKVYTVKEDLFEIGVDALVTPFGNTVRVYNMERTICDVIRSRNTIEVSVFQEALKRYVKRNDKNLHQLMEYAKKFRVERIIRQYLEVLL